MTQRQRINARRRYRAAREAWRNYQATTRKKTKRGAKHTARVMSKSSRRMVRGLINSARPGRKLDQHLAEKWWAMAQKAKK